MRAFVAVEIPEAVKEGLAAVQARLKSAGVAASWSRPEAVHLTLKFLGEVSEARAPEIIAALALAAKGAARFRLCAEGVGTFPGPAAARVVWLGVTGDVGSLRALRNAVERVMGDLGMKPDDRPYTPHLTLGRIRQIRKREAWLTGLNEVRNVRLPGFDVTAVSLISSDPRPEGAVYRELGSVTLEQGSAPAEVPPSRSS